MGRFINLDRRANLVSLLIFLSALVTWFLAALMVIGIEFLFSVDR